MTTLTFLGATGTVTGSRFSLDIDGKKVLIDCGLFQGKKANRKRNWDPFTIDPAFFSKVLLTHAHIDHTGYLPRFCKDGFSGDVLCTHSTSDLVKIMLRDSAKLQEEDADYANRKGFSKHDPALPLYTLIDAELAINRLTPINYDEDYFLRKDVRAKFKDAGHILGSSFIDFKRYRENGASRKILFSGDFGRTEKIILRQPVQVYNVDYLILESTYGDRRHDETSSIYTNLAHIINESINRGGVLLIPAFAVGRTQTLLYVIRELEEQKLIPSLPIFLDSPMAINVTDVFKKRIIDQSYDVRMRSLQGMESFRPKNLTLCHTRDQSKSINSIKNNAIIISASGMATGGRILHHLAARLPYPEHTILFIGYQAEGTRGRTIAEHRPAVKIHGQQVACNARVETISGFSGHADYMEILAWLMCFNKPPETTFIVHGEPQSSASLAEKIQKEFGWNVVIPSFGDSFELDF